VTGEGGHCSFCGATSGPFATVEWLFTVWICIPCLEVARMYQEPGLAWLERQAEAAEQLLAERQAAEQN
jgi:hypothetical protein